MSRGIGIRIDQEEIAVRPGGIGQGAVRAPGGDIPDVNFGTQIQAGRQLQEIGEQLYAKVRHDQTTKAAQSAPFGIDAEGNYTRPENPAFFAGIDNDAVWDRIVDQRYVDTVFKDLEGDANSIAAEHWNDPAAGEPKMRAAIEGRLAKVEPRIAAMIAPLAEREFNQRSYTMRAERRREDYRNLGQELEQRRVDEMDRALSAAAIGEDGRAQEHFSLAMGAQERRVALGMDHPGSTKRMSQDYDQLRNAATIIRKIDQAANDGTLTLDDFRYLRAMAEGADAESSVQGITQKAIFDGIPNEKVRLMLQQRLGRIEQRYMERAASDAAKAKADKLGILLDPSRGVRPGNRGLLSPEELKSAGETLAAQHGLHPIEPKAIDLYHRVIGEQPAKLIRDSFAGVAARGPAHAAGLLNSYRTLKRLSDDDGDDGIGQTGLLAPEDQLYMELFSNAMDGFDGKAADPVKAHAAARAAIKGGVDELKEVLEPHVWIRDEIRRQGGTPPDQDLRAVIRGSLPNAEGLGLAEERRLLGQVALGMAAGAMSYDAAVKRAVQTFQATHAFDKNVIAGGRTGGWVHRDNAVPMSMGVGTGNPTDMVAREVVGKLLTRNKDGSKDTVSVDVKVPWAAETDADGNVIRPAGEETQTRTRMRDPLVPPVQGGHVIDKLDLGTNAWLRPIGQGKDRSYVLMWSPHPGQVAPLEVRDAELQPIVLRLDKIVADHDAEARKKIADPEQRRRLIDGAADAASLSQAGRHPILGRAEALADAIPLKDVDPMQALVNRRPAPGSIPADNTEETSRGRGRARRELNRPVRQDGVPALELMVVNSYGGALPGEGGAAVREATPPSGGRDPFPEGTNPGAGELVQAFRRDGRTRIAGADPALVNGLASLINAMPPELRRQFRIGSMVRTRAEQEAIYTSTVERRGARNARKWAAVPGGSKHEDTNGGMAADLQMPAAVRRWVHDHAEDHGLWFPMGHEPWHVEPIGSRPGRGPRPKGDRVALLEERRPPLPKNATPEQIEERMRLQEEDLRRIDPWLQPRDKAPRDKRLADLDDDADSEIEA